MVKSLSLLILLFASSVPEEVSPPLIVGGTEGKGALAALELQRYLYLRTGALSSLAEKAPANGPAILLEVDDRLGEEAYSLKTRGERLHITGGSDLGLLYGACAFLEKLGIRFHLHGDVVPDDRIAPVLPVLDETHEPLFERRGIQPFHDFPEGPDWWELDDYRAYLAQMVKMRMNFIGFHCYPETNRHEEKAPAEPLIWLGLPEDVEPDGDVRFAYRTYWANTAATQKWGYGRAKTSDFAAGAGMIFDRDYFGHSLLEGYPERPSNREECREVFNNTGRFLNRAFSFGRSLGIRVAVGTQAPLEIPRELAEHLKEKGLNPFAPETVRKLYEGAFLRIQRSHPIDYYWLWTHEGWLGIKEGNPVVGRAVGEMKTAHEVLAEMGNPFRLATCGWVLGPSGNRGLFDRELPGDVPVSCINRGIGFEPVDDAFLPIRDRSKWAIPWVEDDSAMIAPQLWVGRIRRDAADALAFGCNGLMGIHWRTKVLSPNFGALASAAWEQRSWNLRFGEKAAAASRGSVDVRTGGRTARYAGDDLPVVYRTCRSGMDSYRIGLPDGTYDVRLQFCETRFKKPGERFFDVVVGGKKVEGGVDVVRRGGAAAPLDVVVEDVRVEDGCLVIRFESGKEDPIISGIVIDGMRAAFNQFKAAPYVRKINCGGTAEGDYEGDLPNLSKTGDLPPVDRDLPADDYYADWCVSQFGPEAGPALARFFTGLDGGKGDYRNPGRRHELCRLPQPSEWCGGPGFIRIHTSDWDRERLRYAFVDEMESMRPRVKGRGAKARFDYWLETFKYMRAMARLACVRGRLDEAMAKIEKAPDPEMRKRLAEGEALPLRIRIARLWEEMMTRCLATVSTPGEMGTIANLEMHVRRNNRIAGIRFLDRHDEKLVAALGRALPGGVEPSTEYRGAPRIIVPTRRTLIDRGEAPSLRVILLDPGKPGPGVLRWRPLGCGAWKSLPLTHVARGVHSVAFPETDSTFECYLEVRMSSGDLLHWPPSAPELNHTVVVR